MKYLTPLLLFIFACTNENIELSTRCAIVCYEAKNDIPIYETYCPHHSIIYITNGGNKAEFIYKLKHPKYYNVYKPFDEINQNIDKFSSCEIRFKGNRIFK